MMRTINILKIITLGFFITLFSNSCKKDLFEPSWKTKIAIPIASSNLTVKDLLNDSSMLIEDPDNKLRLAINNEIYRLENPLRKYVNLDVKAFSQIITLSSLSLEDQSVNNRIIFGDIIENLPSGSPKPEDGSVLPSFFIPIINSQLGNLAGLSNDLDISDFLVEAKLTQGDLYTKIGNSTNFDIKNLKYSIKNTDDGVIIANGNIPLIAKGTIYENNLDLAKQLGENTIKGKLSVSIEGFELAVPNNAPTVLIDYKNFIDFNLEIKNIKVSEAKAVFPPQRVIDAEDMSLVDAENNVKIVFAKIDTGEVNIKGYSSVAVDQILDYEVPNIVKNGTPFFFRTVIGNEFQSSINPKDTTFTFNDFDFDFSVHRNNSKTNVRYDADYNAFYSIVRDSIQQTASVVDISLKDTISVTVDIRKIQPSYAEGFLGTTTENVKEGIKLDVFGELDGKIEFKEVNARFRIDNEIGVDAQVLIKNLVAINTKTNEQKIYTGDKGPFQIKRAKSVVKRQSFLKEVSYFELTNADDLLNILPDSIYIELDLVTNPEGDNGKFDNFIYKNTGIVAGVELDIPMELSIENLKLKDTVDLKPDPNFVLDQNIGSGLLTLNIGNSFPMETSVKFSFFDKNGNKLLTLDDPKTIASGILDKNGVVLKSTLTSLNYKVNRDDIEKILKAESLILEALLNTSNKQQVKFYSDNSLDVQLVLDLDYNTKRN